MSADLRAESDLDRLAGVAIDLAEKVRHENPATVLTNLVGLCRDHPVKAAQLLMVFSVWLDPETPCPELWARVERATEESIVARRRVRVAV